MSFTDSFLDFDAIKDWFENNTNADMADREKANDGVNVADFCCKTGVQEHIINETSSIDIGSKPIVDESRSMDCGSHTVVKVIERECEMLENASCSIENEIKKVSLVCGSGNSVGTNERGTKCEATDENGVKCETVINEGGSNSSESAHASTSSLSSSSSSSSSSSDDDVEVDEEEDEDKGEEMKLDIEKKFNDTGEVEEGEIRNANWQDMASKNDDDDDDDDVNNSDAEVMVGWSDSDDVDDEENDGGAMKGPIKSKHELKDLPPVPPVDATLLPHHQMLPVGAVLSVIGRQVIVEGIEKHNPLNDGSILWITKSKSPLGLVDEIFGPVKHPYYIVRYNSESEVPAGIHTGTLISFVPEFASHVLNNKDIYKKGYDASGANDEEVSGEVEFSDDEKEAEYKRMQKMTKRGGNDQKPRNNKNNKMNVKNQYEPWKKGKQSPQETLTDVGPAPPNQHQGHISALPAIIDHGSVSNSFRVGQGLVSGASLVPPLPPIAQTACFNAPSNGIWGNGMPFQQAQGALLSNGFPLNGMPWLSQNLAIPLSDAFSNTVPFQRQVDPSQRLFSAAVFPGGQLNAIPGSIYPQGLVGHNAFNPVAFGIGLQGQPSQPTLNVGEQGIIPNAPQPGQNPNVPQPGQNSNNEASQQFNLGASTHGRGPYRRGGGRFASRRGRKQFG